MAYIEHARPLSSEAVDGLLALSRRIDLAPGPGGSRITPLKPMELAVCFELVGDLWRVSWDKAQMIVLLPSQQLVAHTDPPLRGRRCHVPLAVNQGCWSFHAGVWQQLEIGHIYEMDPAQEHGAVNWGSTARLHLMIDTEH